MSWLDCFTVIDFETSGVDADTDRVLEIGLARFEQRRLVERCDYLVTYPGMTITPELTQINGLTPEMFVRADGTLWDEFPQTWPALCDLFDVAQPVAYNTPFDRRFLQAELRRHRGAWPASVLAAQHVSQPRRPWLDPLPFIWKVDKFKKGKKLVQACERRGIPIAQAHRAVDDAVATGTLLLHLFDERQIPAETPAAVSIQAGLRVHQEFDRAQYNASKIGQSVTGGSVYTCDACDGVAFVPSESKLPDGWSKHQDLHTCSVGCDAQLLWWRAAAQPGAALEH